MLTEIIGQQEAKKCSPCSEGQTSVTCGERELTGNQGTTTKIKLYLLLLTFSIILSQKTGTYRNADLG